MFRVSFPVLLRRAPPPFLNPLSTASLPRLPAEMAAHLRGILRSSTSRRPYPIKNPPLLISTLLRSLSSSTPISPVSYPVKPQDPSSSSSDDPPSSSSSSSSAAPPPNPSPDPRPSWTREDARYVRDVPSISPVSYPLRVAPLPEFKPSKEKDDEPLEEEGKKIAAVSGVLGRFDAAEKIEKVPFPTLIKLARKPPKAVLDLNKAIKEVKANAKRNFLETVEAHVRLGVNPRRSDQMVRGAVTLPRGVGKVVRVAVFAEGSEADEARAAGADIIGGDELVEEIIKGAKLNFDKCLSTPSFMPRLGKIARILGPRGLMPNPKLGSLTRNIAGAVKEAKCGRVDFKMDNTAIVHAGLGKVNFSDGALRENIGAFINALLIAKPSGLKKTSKFAGYVNDFSLCSTMGPGFSVSIQSLSDAADHYNKLYPKSAE